MRRRLCFPMLLFIILSLFRPYPALAADSGYPVELDEIGLSVALSKDWLYALKPNSEEGLLLQAHYTATSLELFVRFTADYGLTEDFSGADDEFLEQWASAFEQINNPDGTRIGEVKIVAYDETPFLRLPITAIENGTEWTGIHYFTIKKGNFVTMEFMAPTNKWLASYEEAVEAVMGTVKMAPGSSLPPEKDIPSSKSLPGGESAWKPEASERALEKSPPEDLVEAEWQPQQVPGYLIVTTIGLSLLIPVFLLLLRGWRPSRRTEKSDPRFCQIYPAAPIKEEENRG